MSSVWKKVERGIRYREHLGNMEYRAALAAIMSFV